MGHVRLGSEEAACRTCSKLIDDAILLDCFTPKAEHERKRRGDWYRVMRLLYPGYIFLLTKSPKQLGKELGRISASVELVAPQEDGFDTLSVRERKWLEAVLDETHVIRFSRGVIHNGQTIVQEGPLQGREDCIRKIDRHKCTASITASLAGKEALALVGLAITEKS